MDNSKTTINEKQFYIYDLELKKIFCNTRIGKLLLDESFEEFYANFVDNDGKFKEDLFNKTIAYINKLLAENSMNIRYESIEKYTSVYSDSVSDVLSDKEEITSSLLKLKEDIMIFSGQIFKQEGEVYNKDEIKKYIREFINSEKEKITTIKGKYLNISKNNEINILSKKIFDIITKKEA